MVWSISRSVAAALAALLLATSAAAQYAVRAIPANAERAVLRPLGGMMVDLNGQPMRLGAGVQIRDTYNRIVLPATLPPQAQVKFTLDLHGLVHRVWILTPAEVAQPDARK